jgi:hypothetical protein
LSIFTARIGLTIDAGSVGKPSKGHVGGGGGAVVVVGGGVVVVVVVELVVVGALLALSPPPHAVRTTRHEATRPIQRRLLRVNVFHCGAPRSAAGGSLAVRAMRHT